MTTVAIRSIILSIGIAFLSSTKVSSAVDVGSLPLAFTVNQGQWDQSVRFQARADGANIWFTSEGVQYQFFRTAKSPLEPAESRQGLSSIAGEGGRTANFESMLIGARWVNANLSPAVEGVTATDYRCNYFIGREPSGWRTDVPNFESVVYKEVYPGIDLKFYGNGRKMEYDFIVHPGGALSRVEIEYQGIRSLSVNDIGDLVVATRWGTVTEHAPLVYQEIAGSRRVVRGQYELRGNNRFGFKITGEYNEALALIVDPVVSFSTYLGGITSDQSFDIAVNSAGEVYTIGISNSSDYPTLAAYDNTLNTNSDVVVTKFNSAGSALVFSTFIGGTGRDEGRALNISQASGFGIAITGSTTSADFPVPDALDASHNGGTKDAFLAVLSNAGNSLLFGTFLGGSSDDESNDIAVLCGTTFCDTYNYNVWLTGTTYSTNLPVVNAVQTTHGGGITDAFLTRYNFTLFAKTLVYCAYYGGSNPDRGMSLAVSGSPVKAYVAGESSSSNLPGMNGFQTLYGGGTDVFIAAFSVNGSSQVYPSQATYFGGTSGEFYPSIISRSAGVVHLYCGSNSPGLATPGAYDQTLTSIGKLVLAKFSSTLAARDFCTYLGPNNGVLTRPGYFGSALAIDSKGNMYVTGRTDANDFPMVDPWDSIYGGQTDAIAAKMNPTGSALLFSSYAGGSIEDYGHAIAVDAGGCMYVDCETYSGNFPTLNAYDNTLSNPNGWTDIALVKICLPECCVNLTGNVDCDPGDGSDISDLSALIDNLYISFVPLCCTAEANVDGQPGIDISDLSALIDYLYISFTRPAACQ